jgi:hypothetical protein
VADLNGVSALILQQVGKGYALLLNGDLNTMMAATTKILSRFGSKSRRVGQAELFEDAPLGAILRSLAGVKADIALRREDGSVMRDLEVIRWKNGKNGLVALFREGGKSEPVTVSLSKPAHVYDLRNRKFLGNVREFKVEIFPNRASFFAVLSKPAPPFKVQMAGNGQRGKVAVARLNLPEAQGSHAFDIIAKFPAVPSSKVRHTGDFFPRQGYPSVNISQDQDKRYLLRRVVVAGNDPITIDIPIAFNDPPGNYEIFVTELFTNKTKIKKLIVQ